MLPQAVSASTAHIIPKALKRGIGDIFLKLIAVSIDMDPSPSMFFILCCLEVEVFLREDAFRLQPGAVGY